MQGLKWMFDIRKGFVLARVNKEAKREGGYVERGWG